MRITFSYSVNNTNTSAPITGKVEGLDNIEFTRKLKPENTANSGFSSELTFYDDGYDIIKLALIDNPEGKVSAIYVIIEDDCCTGLQPFNGIIRGDEIEWYEGKCFVKATVKDDSTFVKTMACLDSTMIWQESESSKDANGKTFKEWKHPRIAYCNEIRPGSLQVFMILVVGILIINLTILRPLIKLISGAFYTDLINQYDAMVKTLGQSAVGVGRVHPSPLVRDYVLNACKVCGIKNFSSSILNDPKSTYYNTVYFHAPTTRGLREQDTRHWIDSNRPQLSAKQFLDEIKQAHNAEWSVVGDTLYYERKDLLNINTATLNYNDISSRILNPIAYEWLKHETPAAATFTYLQDGIDEIGDEVRVSKYTLDMNFNDPDSSPVRKGYKTYTLPYGTAAFREDIDSVLTDFDGQMIPEITPNIRKSQKYISMSKETAGFPKLLIWDGNTNTIKRAIVKDKNKAYRFIPGEAGNIYSDFFYIEDTRIALSVPRGFSLSFRYECDELRQFNNLSKIVLPTGNGQIEEISYKPKTRTMTIKGTV